VAKGQSELSPDERDIVVATLRNFEGQRYRLIGYVVMNDHLHVVVEPSTGYDLTAIVQSWKSYTTNRMQRSCGRKGRVWQREYFDRVIRDDDELNNRLAYILRNPSERWPDIQEYSWAWVDGV
jgi:REP element-mobilizing transposase RayT